MPFVEVHAGEVMPERLEGTNASHTQQVFLTDARVIVATVQSGPNPTNSAVLLGWKVSRKYTGTTWPETPTTSVFHTVAYSVVPSSGNWMVFPVLERCSAGSMGA